MAGKTDWSKIKISGNTYVSNFTSIENTHGNSVEYTPEQLGEPEQELARFGANYYPVYLDHYEDGDAYIRINNEVYKIAPGLRVLKKVPLNYAWTETEVYVEPK